MKQVSRAVHVGLLGHWGRNIGHDLMALGVEEVLREAFAGQARLIPIEQHRPGEIYPRWHPLRYIRALDHGREGTPAFLFRQLVHEPRISRILWRSTWVGQLDLAVACGGPLITPGVSRGDLRLMFDHVPGAIQSKGVPVLNLSIGSCFPFERIPRGICDQADADFLHQVLAHMHTTTTRDELARQLLETLGATCPLIPDTGLIAGRTFLPNGRRPSGSYVVVNYQKHGANEDWGQHVDSAAWKQTMGALVHNLSRHHDVRFVCHSDHELRLAEELNPTIARVLPGNVREYGQFVAGAMVGICSRIHAAVALASVGIPVVGVGTDSRLGTLQSIGLPCFYVKKLTADVLEEVIEQLIARRLDEYDRLIRIREAALRHYVEIVQQAMDRAWGWSAPQDSDAAFSLANGGALRHSRQG